MDKSGMDSLDYLVSDKAVEVENQSDDSSSGSSLFKTQCVTSSPTQRQRNPTRKFVHLPESVTDSSSDSSIEPKPLTLKAIFERFKKKKHRKRKRKYKPKLRTKEKSEGRRKTKRSQIDKKQIKNKGPRHPFLQSENERKPLPWRKILAFEQAVARGFFNYIEKLKYEHHLKESLKQMNVGEDLEKEDLDSRRYKYLDDDGSISPIEESVADEETARLEHECDIKLVENSCFIISCDFPKKMNVHLEQENNKETALSKKRASNAKNIGQNTECPERR